MQKISAKQIEAVSKVWLIFLIIILLILYIGGERPFSHGFVIAIVSSIGMIGFLSMKIGQLIMERVEELERRINMNRKSKK